MNDSFTSLSFQTLLSAVSDAVLLIDDTGHVALTNPAAQRLFGYTDQELCGLEVEELMPYRYRELYRHHQKDYVSNPQKRAVGNGKTLSILNSDGQEIAVNITLNPVSLKKRLYVLIILNITDRRHQAENALRASEERLLLAKQAAGFGIFDFDFKHNKAHCDERMRELWSCGNEEIMTHEKFLAAIHSSDRAIHKTAFNNAIDSSGNGEYHAEFRVISPVDSTERWIIIFGQVHFESGRASRLVGIAQDITPRKTLEKELQIQRTETEMLFKQQVAIHTASAIAHELNQPLTAISAYSEVALRAMERNSFNTAEVKNALESCVKQTQRAGQSLHELVAFLQKSEVVNENLSLNEVVMDALKIARNDGYNDFQLQLQLEPNLPPVLANRLHIQKALVNLLTNAAEAMRAENMSTSTIKITVKTLLAENMASVTVQDNGPGVEQALTHQIFEPFFTTKPTGIGMGLAISRALIEANGGQLWIDPDMKEGAKFHFTLPIAA